jgi:hypothetical protein
MIPGHSHQFAKMLTLVPAASIVLVAITATPAQAGSGGFNVTGSMNVARMGHTATLLQSGEVLVTGGLNYTDSYLASAELYNPSTGKWTLTGSMTSSRIGHNTVLLQNGEVLVAGGTNASIPSGSCASLASAELYNPSTGTWTATGSMTIGRTGFALTVLPNGEALAAGGSDCGVLSSAELYNPATGTWTATGSMTSGSQGPGAVPLQNGHVFETYNINLYNPSTGTWTGPAPFQHRTYPFVLLPNGNVFLGGGGIFGDELYNPSTAQMTNIPPTPCATSKQDCESAGALLNTGMILVAGGVTYVNAQPYPIEETNGLAALLDPSTLSWTTTGSMNKSRINETMTVLPNGQALVAGGETYDKHLGHLVQIASAELYTP